MPHPLGACGSSTPPILKSWVRHWLTQADRSKLEAFEMWIWRRMEKISWVDTGGYKWGNSEHGSRRYKNIKTQYGAVNINGLVMCYGMMDYCMMCWKEGCKAQRKKWIENNTQSSMYRGRGNKLVSVTMKPGHMLEYNWMRGVCHSAWGLNPQASITFHKYIHEVLHWFEVQHFMDVFVSISRDNFCREMLSEASTDRIQL